MGCKAVWTCCYIPAIRMNILPPPSSGLVPVCVQSATSCAYHVDLSLLFKETPTSSPPPSSRCTAFIIYRPAGIPPPPALPYQLMVSLLISYNYFTSSLRSFPFFILKSGKTHPSETNPLSGSGLEGLHISLSFRTRQIPARPAIVATSSRQSSVFLNVILSNV